MFVTIETFWTIFATAALTAVLTGLSTYGVWWSQRRSAETDARNAARDAAYIGLLHCLLDFPMRTRALGDMMHFRSGLKEDSAVVTGQRKALDPVEFIPRMMDEFRPIYAAWSAVHIHGSQAGIDLADKILDTSSDLMLAATSANHERSKLSRYLFGERWTEKKSATYDEALRRMMRLRADLVHLARSEADREAVIMAIDEASA